MRFPHARGQSSEGYRMMTAPMGINDSHTAPHKTPSKRAWTSYHISMELCVGHEEIHKLQMGL